MRGAGANFGVVSSLEFRLHPVGPTVLGGLVAHPFDAAVDVLRFYRDYTADAPDELMTFGGLGHAPDGSGAKIALIVACHVGAPEQAEKDLQPLRDFGSPIMVQLGPLPYTVMNSLLDAAYPTGSLNYWKSAFFAELSDEAIDAIAAAFAQAPTEYCAILLEHFHGAVTRVGATETAVPHRDEGYNMLLPSVWLDPAETEANVAWTRATFDLFKPYLAGRRWLNYFSDDDLVDAVRAAYGPNYDRLVEVKRRYDPTNFFRLNQNIEPTA